MDPIPLLPPHLRERTRLVGSAASIGPGYVLCWLRVTLRADENPALDAAIVLANDLGRPLLVYQGLDERTPQATDRTHRFILQGAAELHAELGARGVQSVLHVARAGHRGPHLRTLASQAALVVTDEFPLPPLRTWTDRLAAGLSVPVLAVDGACLVPMGIDGPPGRIPPPDRAFRFRDRHARTRSARLVRRWPVLTAPPPPGPRTALPFPPVDLASLVDDPPALDRAIAALCALQEIDHGVPPVPSPRGGTRAGTARWETFRDDGLGRYHKTRNDPLRDGVSGLSPWLHFGMVSPFRVAREAFDAGGAGADKFLDELLVWRELAWHFCFHHPAPHDWSVVPEWARRSLEAHAADPRPSVHGWETLLRGRTGHPLWDAAQRSLLLHGTLHNNLRMTWAKAAIPWMDDPRRALPVLLDLNDRLALDGRDPSSVGGVGWALGLFDRPFTPERPVTGALRPRDLDAQARRTDPDRLSRRVGLGLRPSMPSVAVIGAGVAGLACARTLQDFGCRVTVFDKGRGPGGRCSTRRATADGASVRVDHGATAIMVDDARFGRFVRSWRTEGIVDRWEGVAVRIEGGTTRPDPTPRRIGRAGNSAVPRHLATGLTVRTSTRVHQVRRRGAWALRDEAGADLGVYDRVVVAVPAPQAAPLLEGAPRLADAAGRIAMAPALALMLAPTSPPDIAWDLADFVDHPVLKRVHRSRRKAGRGAVETWVLHARADWSERHLEHPLDDVADSLAQSFASLGGGPIAWRQAHRWRYAFAVGAGVGPRGHLWDDALGIGACGDWCRGDGGPERGLQQAWLSGVSLAGAMLAAEVDRPERGQTRLF